MFSARVLGSDDEPRDRSSYQSSCKHLLGKVAERNKVQHQRKRTAARAGAGSPISICEPGTSTPGVPEEFLLKDRGPSGPSVHISGHPLPIPSLDIPFIESNNGSYGAHWEEATVLLDGEIGMEKLRGLTDQQLDTFLGVQADGNLPLMSPRVPLLWHQKVFVLFALARLFQPEKARAWGGLALFDAPGLGKTGSALGVYATLRSELSAQTAGSPARKTPFLSMWSLC